MALSVGVLPSLAIGVAAYGASELIFHTTKKEENNKEKTMQENLMEAKNTSNQIAKIVPYIEDKELVDNIKEINETIIKIIKTVENKPEKYKVMENFFNYYLPTTKNILYRYDEIENQNLTSDEGKEFMKKTEKMIKNINVAFKKQLSNLYQSDMIDTDAEMKVFNSMLKSEGYEEEADFKLKQRGKES